MKTFSLTVDQLHECLPTLNMSEILLPVLQDALNEFHINTRTRVCSFLAHLGHESADLMQWRENLNYSATRLRQVFPKYFRSMAEARAFANNPVAIAEVVYGGRMGNDTAGDGWKFRGGGPMQITGRDMYAKCGHALSLPLEVSPELLELPRHGLRSACWVWSVEKNCNPLADALRGVADKDELLLLTAQTKRINGGTNGLNDRVLRYGRCLRAIPPRSSTVSAPTAVAPPPVTATSDQPDQLSEFEELLQNGSVQNVAKRVASKTWSKIWKPLTALISAVEAGNAFAISSVVVVAIFLVVLVVLYHRQIWRVIKQLVAFVNRLIKKG